MSVEIIVYAKLLKSFLPVRILVKEVLLKLEKALPVFFNAVVVFAFSTQAHTFNHLCTMYEICAEDF